MGKPEKRGTGNGQPHAGPGEAERDGTVWLSFGERGAVYFFVVHLHSFSIEVVALGGSQWASSHL